MESSSAGGGGQPGDVISGGPSTSTTAGGNSSISLAIQAASSNELDDHAKFELLHLVERFLEGGNFGRTAALLRRELTEKKLVPHRYNYEGRPLLQSYGEFLGSLRSMPVSFPPTAASLPSMLTRLATLTDSSVPPSSGGLRLRLITAKRNAVDRRPAVLLKSTAQRQMIQRRSCARFKGRTLIEILEAREMGAYTPSHRLPPPSSVDLYERHFRILGHLANVFCVKFDRTGNYILTGADDNLVKVWVAARGLLRFTYRGHGSEITDFTISHCNQVVASGSIDKTVRVWKLCNGETLAVYKHHTAMISYLAFLPYADGDRRWLTTVSYDCAIFFYDWNVKTLEFSPQQTARFFERDQPGARIVSLCHSPGGQLVVIGETHGCIRIYRISKSGVFKIFDVVGHPDRVDSLEWAHGGLRFVSGGKDGVAKIWRFAYGEWACTLLSLTPAELLAISGSSSSPHNKNKYKVTMVCWTLDDSKVVTTGSDHSFRTWCSETGSPLLRLAAHTDDAFHLCAHPIHSHLVFSAGHDGFVIIWDVETGRIVKRWQNRVEQREMAAIYDMAITSDAQRIAYVDNKGHVSLYALGKNSRALCLPRQQFFNTDYMPLLADSSGFMLDEQLGIVPHLMPPPTLINQDGEAHPFEYQAMVPGRDLIHSTVKTEPSTQSSQDEAAAHVMPGTDNPEGMQCAWLTRQIVPPLNQHQLAIWDSEASRMASEEAAEFEFELSRVRPASSAGSNDPIVQTRERKTKVKGLARIAALLYPNVGGGLAGGGGGMMTATREAAAVGVSPLTMTSSQQTRYIDPQAVLMEQQLQQQNGRIAIPDIPSAFSSSSSSSSEEEEEGETTDTSDTDFSMGEQREQRRPRAETSTTRRRVRTEESGLGDEEGMEEGEEDEEETSLVDEEEDEEEEDEMQPSTSTRPATSRPRSKRKARQTKPNYHIDDDDDEVLPELAASTSMTRGSTTRKKQNYAAGRRGSQTSMAMAASLNEEVAAGVERERKPPASRRPKTGEWLRSFPDWMRKVEPRRFPYIAQVGDHVVYFRQGHETYISNVEQKKIYPVHDKMRPKPELDAEEFAVVDDVHYTLKPYRLTVLRLSRVDQEGRRTAVSWHVKHHDLQDVPDFIVLRSIFEESILTAYDAGDPIEAVIDDQWWTGSVEAVSALDDDEPNSSWMNLKIRWDTGEDERMSPWDVQKRMSGRRSGQPVSSEDLLQLAKSKVKPGDWPEEDPEGTATRRRLAEAVEIICHQEVVSVFTHPVDTAEFPSYPGFIDYPIDLTTVIKRLENGFYRSLRAFHHDVRYIAINAQLFNDPSSTIVRNARVLVEAIIRFSMDSTLTDIVPFFDSCFDLPTEELREYRHRERVHDVASSRSVEPNPSENAAVPIGGWVMECEAVLDGILRESSARHFLHSEDSVEELEAVWQVGVADLTSLRRLLIEGEITSPKDLEDRIQTLLQLVRGNIDNRRSQVYKDSQALSSICAGRFAASVTKFERAVASVAAITGDDHRRLRRRIQKQQERQMKQSRYATRSSDAPPPLQVSTTSHSGRLLSHTQNGYYRKMVSGAVDRTTGTSVHFGGETSSSRRPNGGGRQNRVKMEQEERGEGRDAEEAGTSSQKVVVQQRTARERSAGRDRKKEEKEDDDEEEEEEEEEPIDDEDEEYVDDEEVRRSTKKAKESRRKRRRQTTSEEENEEEEEDGEEGGPISPASSTGTSSTTRTRSSTMTTATNASSTRKSTRAARASGNKNSRKAKRARIASTDQEEEEEEEEEHQEPSNYGRRAVKTTKTAIPNASRRPSQNPAATRPRRAMQRMHYAEDDDEEDEEHLPREPSYSQRGRQRKPRVF